MLINMYMKKQANKHRSIISILNKIFGKNSTVFKSFSDSNVIELYSLPEMRIYIYTWFSHSFFPLFVCLLALLVWLYHFHVIIASMSFIIAFMCFQ